MPRLFTWGMLLYITPMKDLFGDLMLLIPVIIILTIFGIGYVGFMIWAYNRDAKKHGKKSGCLPMIFFLLLVLFAEFATIIM